jgi:hypothetical protein
MPMMPCLQSASRRPVASPRELFEMSSLSPVTRSRFFTTDQKSPTTEITEPFAPGMRSPMEISAVNSRSNSYSSRYNVARSGSQRSYASDIAPKALLTGLNTTKPLQDDAFTGLSDDQRPSGRAMGLRIQTGSFLNRTSNGGKNQIRSLFEC